MGTNSICSEQYVGIWNMLSNCSENLKAELKCVAIRNPSIGRWHGSHFSTYYYYLCSSTNGLLICISQPSFAVFCRIIYSICSLVNRKSYVKSLNFYMPD